MTPDIVYVVRPGDDNEELRYSLRSLAANGPGGRVWVVGSVPSWLRNVHGLPLVPVPDKFGNQRQSLHAVAAHPRISDPFVLFNDDMFVMRPVDEWATRHLGPIEDHFGGTCNYVAQGVHEWLHAVWTTRTWMRAQGHINPPFYETHTPLLYDKRRLAEVLSSYPHDWPLVVNGTYPICGAGGVGTLGRNVKLAGGGAGDVLAAVTMDSPFLSTEETAFAAEPLGEHIRNTFPDPCMYEEASK